MPRFIKIFGTFNLKLVTSYLLIFLLPTQLGTFFFIKEAFISGIRIDYLAPSLFLTDLIVLVLIILHRKLLTTHLFSRKNLTVKIIIVTGLLLNMVFAIEPIIALFRVVKIFELLGVYIIIRHTKLTHANVLTSFAAGAGIQLGLVLFQVMNGQSMQGIAYFLGERAFTLSTPGIAKVAIGGVEILRGYGTFPHPNVLAGFYLLLYTYALFHVPDNQKLSRMPYLLRASFLGLCTILIVFSFSKIAIAGLVILTTLHVLRRKYDCVICNVSKLIVPIILAVIVFSATGDAESIEKRVYLAKSALSIISSYPIFGVGLGNYLYAQAEFPITYSYFFLQPVHNIFLLVLAELGIPLFMFIAYCLLRSAYRMSEGALSTHYGLQTTHLFVIFTILFTGMFDHYWLTLQQNILLVPVVLGLLYRDTHVVK